MTRWILMIEGKSASTVAFAADKMVMALDDWRDRRKVTITDFKEAGSD